MEAAGIAIYLFLVCIFAGLLLYPASPVRHLISNGGTLRALMGLAVGTAVAAIVLSPWGKQSGGHFNPAVTVAFYRLGKMALPDAVFYVTAQFSGAIGGVCAAKYLLPGTAGRIAVKSAVNAPGVRGSAVAFIAELTISFVLMAAILMASNRQALARYTPFIVGFLYAIFLFVEAPLSGTSLNPARTFAPALHVGHWHALWVYLAGPTLGMLVAAEVFLRARGGVRPFCGKLHHANDKRCIFRHETARDADHCMGGEDLNANHRAEFFR